MSMPKEMLENEYQKHANIARGISEQELEEQNVSAMTEQDTKNWNQKRAEKRGKKEAKRMKKADVLEENAALKSKLFELESLIKELVDKFDELRTIIHNMHPATEIDRA
ncbi:hypothetical protein ASPZODRAFT_132582 [Penicilliopsis zonata CBS 506.65]|uniref:Uncharacterized protein n=1 Tax=Penicilliopsis zonata CBS 506.65 TaxID=1073090 RepID=A0A1L9SHE0_9EURO|nr:hypothetical protein ASPZODRAFT_132582 [Penicilliopsis zonata CBS 506.65]OJJ46506.1 hypothetical protein ASPZODRAFT_132582 [Penicilliopsis zonata CBS 506.65]